MRNTNKWLLPIATMSVAGLLLAGCGNSGTNSNNAATNTPAGSTAQPKDGGTLTISTFSDIVNADPLFIQDTSSGDVDNFMLANMYDVNRQGDITAEPWSLADGPLKVSDDGLTYTIKLKQNAKWSDGTPVTADDVVWTIQTIVNPASNSVLISGFDHVKDVKKLDDYTVQVDMKSLYAPFQYSLNIPALPAHILKDVPLKDLAKNPYGTDPTKTVTDGPWNWTEWKQKQYLKFDRNPNYWGPKPHIDSVVYKIYADQNTEVQAMLKGDTDELSAIPITQLSAVQAHKNIQTILAPGPQFDYIGFNFDPKNFPGGFDPFTSKETRQAIAYAVDPASMVKNILKGVGTTVHSAFLPAPVGWTGADDAATKYEYNPDKAKQMLKEDGWTAGPDGILTKDGHRFTFDLLTNTGNSRRAQVSAVIQEELKAVGIDVKLKAIDFSSLAANYMNPGKFEAVLMGQQMSVDPDVKTLFGSKYTPPAGQNMFWYKNADVDKALEDGTATLDKAKRSAAYQQAAKLMSDDLPMVYLYQYGLPMGFSPRVQWADADKPESALGYGYFFHIQNWWIDSSK